LNESEMPYCAGCGHKLATTSLAKALDKLGFDPLDVVVVSDIGCCGLVDALVNCHTVHGLHGRSAALAFGISVGLDDPKKKVIVVMGDGGVTIGLQHILECARRNVNMFILVQNNFVYGMTGGQISGLSPAKVKAEKMPEEADVPPFDICNLVHQAGASFSARVIGKADLSGIMAEALSTDGFSLVEVIQTCVAYGVTKFSEIEALGYKDIKLKNELPPFKIRKKEGKPLLEGVPRIEKRFDSPLEGRIEVLVAGSAGGGSQLAAEILTQAAMYAGLNATKKGDFPITVRTGYSNAEVILSRDEPHYTGISSPDVVIISAKEGLATVRGRILPTTTVIIDKGLEPPQGKEVLVGNFRDVAGPRNSTLCAIAFWLRRSGILPVDALLEAVRTHKHSEELEKAIIASERVEVAQK